MHTVTCRLCDVVYDGSGVSFRSGCRFRMSRSAQSHFQLIGIVIYIKNEDTSVLPSICDFFLLRIQKNI